MAALAVAVLFVGGVALAWRVWPEETDALPELPFSSLVWKAAPSHRYYMMRDFTGHHFVVGSDRSRMLAILGSPDDSFPVDPSDIDFFSTLPAPPSTEDVWFSDPKSRSLPELEVFYDQGGRAVASYVTEE